MYRMYDGFILSIYTIKTDIIQYRIYIILYHNVWKHIHALITYIQGLCILIYNLNLTQIALILLVVAANLIFIKPSFRFNDGTITIGISVFHKKHSIARIDETNHPISYPIYVYRTDVSVSVFQKCVNLRTNFLRQSVIGYFENYTVCLFRSPYRSVVTASMYYFCTYSIWVNTIK